MSTILRFKGALGAAIALLTMSCATGCTSLLGEVDFDGSTGGSTSSSTSDTTSSSASSGTTSSTSGTTSSSSTGTGGSGGGSTCAQAMCDPIATCDDSQGKVVCKCPAGYKDDNGDGTKCTDVDECKGEGTGNDCGPAQTCANTPGSFTCACPAGTFEFPAGSHLCPVDPCLPDPCSGNGACANTTGAAVCTCDAHWLGAACDSCVFFVDGGAAGASDGTSWINAFTSIQPALDGADTIVKNGAPTCDVWVKAGTYYSRVSSPFDMITMRQDVGLYGGFAGTEALRSQADPAAHPTILSGHVSAVKTASSYHVVGIYDVSGVVLDGFTIRDGKANGSTNVEDGRGGGVLFYAFHTPASGTISRCEITANACDSGGGGVGTVWGTTSVTLQSCEVHGNTAGSLGGGVHAEGAASVTDCTIHDNVAAGGDGGGIYVGGALSLVGSDLSNNVSSSGGGGMKCVGATCTISGTTFRDNSAVEGAGLYANSLLFADHLTVEDNIASNDGGGLEVYTKLGNSLTDVIFSGNYGNYGGAIKVYGTESLPITNGFFVGNYAVQNGGAIHDYSTNGVALTSCTITGNRAASGGDALRWDFTAPTLTSTIAWGNPSAGAGTDILQPTWASIVTSHSDIHGFGGADNTSFDLNPQFVSMPAFFDWALVAQAASNTVFVASAAIYKVNDVLEIAGDGVGRTVATASGNLVTFAPALGAPAPVGVAIRDWGAALGAIDANLVVGSPCIDKGDPGAPLADLAGQARVGAPDIGAYEHHP